MDEFYQPSQTFDPHKLPLMSSVWPTVGISCVYLFILKIGPKWVNNRDLSKISFVLSSQIDEAPTPISTPNVPRHLQHFSSSLVPLFPRQRFPYRLRVEISLAVPYAGIRESSSCEASLLHISSQGHRANRNGLLRVEEKVTANVVPPHLSPRIDLHLYLFRRDESWKWVKMFGQQTTIIILLLLSIELDGMLLTSYTLNMIVHSIMYSYYFASIYIQDIDKVIAFKKSITIMQMVSDVKEPNAFVAASAFDFRTRLIATPLLWAFERKQFSA